MTKTGTEAYYASRALEYDQVYAKLERQADLRIIERSLAELFAGDDVLEIATGTGYWTQFFADAARSVHATDLNEEVLALARNRRSWKNVDFHVANAFELDALVPTGSGVPPGQAFFTASFAGFFWSHLYRHQLPTFLAHVARQLGPGSRAVFMDNRYVEGSNYPVTRTDADGNTFQQRQLDDGTEWEVLKNFPTPAEIQAAMEPDFTEIEVTEHEYFWIAMGCVRLDHGR